MRRHTAHEAVASGATPKALSDQTIERILRIAFAPYRCDIKFQMDAFNGSEKVVVIIYASRAATSAGGRPFIVEAVNADGLRPCDMLLMYVDEIRKELQRRKIPFTASLQWVHAQVLGLTLASGVAP